MTCRGSSLLPENGTLTASPTASAIVGTARNGDAPVCRQDARDAQRFCRPAIRTTQGILDCRFARVSVPGARPEHHGYATDEVIGGLDLLVILNAAKRSRRIPIMVDCVL